MEVDFAQRPTLMRVQIVAQVGMRRGAAKARVSAHAGCRTTA